ncbi:SWIM zinc finger family protein [Micromonospora sp. WMMD712]|uniref:SWIM zinc finger family protein n=1 Tax=Micromonospora sp. WMMD712 TaxID=3016096 RepID=UPI00249BC7B2|nr:SWIM zinc finger family protein [Micromonospora sp. WMMD712]WFE57025.1 SWIM zinc finger family protein [Micromonospora sp. WMMD712]
MAVSIDIEALRDAAGPAACAAADTLRAAGQPAEFGPAGGGASGVIREAGRPPYEVWVGVTTDGFTAECDCPDGAGLCAHAVALTLAALDEGLAWSSAATPPSALAVDPRVAGLVEIARNIPARRLALLVAEWAAADRVLESRLRAQAGQLASLTAAELNDIRRMIDNLAHEATSGDRWDLHDVEKAGRAIVEEVEVLAQRPPTEETLLLVERAARAWDGLSGYLHDAWETYEEEPAEIGGALRAVHVQLCEQVQPDPDELAARLVEIIEAAEVDSCLDEPWDYLAVLGRERVKALRQLH